MPLREEQYSEAFRALQPLADQKSRTAQAMLGRLYEKGQGVEKDPRIAAEWYRLAAEQGHPDAQLFLGLESAQGQKRTSAI